MSSKFLLRKLLFLRYEYNDQFETEIVNVIFVQLNSEVFIKAELATRLGTGFL